MTLSVVLLFSIFALYSANVRTIANPGAHQSVAPSAKGPAPFVTSSGPLVYTNPVNASVAAVGTSFTVQVKVLNMPQFVGWDIRVWAAPWVLNATSLSITGNDFEVNASGGTAFEIIHCVNGAGTGCSSNDTAGWVHSSFGDSAPVSGNGLLFTITYKVVGNAVTSQLWFGYTPILVLAAPFPPPGSSIGFPAPVLNGNYGTFQLLSSAGGGSHPWRD